MNNTHLDKWLLTEAQKQGVTNTGKRLVVTAGAGTGKTRVLTHRYAHLVLSGQAGIENILAITFTEKAAAEMAQRVGAIFAESHRPDLRRKLQESSVSTIHAFCAKLLRENAIEAGIDPGHDIVSDFEQDLLIEQSLREALAHIGRDQEPFEKLLRTLRTEGRFGADIRTAIWQVYKQILVGRKTISEAFAIEDPTPRRDALLEQATELIAEYRLQASQIKTTTTMEVNEGFLAVLETKLSEPAPEALIAFCKIFKLKLTLGKDLKPVAAQINETVKELYLAATETYAYPTRLALVQLLEAFDSAYRRVKRDNSLLDFSDLEQCTLDLLEQREDVAQALVRRYRFVLVDEYQDINPLQAKLIGKLADPEALFIVGDHKQSIYGFRQADVSVFQEEVQNPDALRISLQKNFRSQGPIIDFVNDYFAKVWQDLPQALGYEPIEPGLKSQTELQSPDGVELLATLAKPDEDYREAEGRTMARRIRNLMDEGNVAPGDIIVLFRSKTQVAPFLAAFIQYHVPFQEEKGRALFTRTEISDLQHMLEVLDDPYNELALACALKSPMAGLDDLELYALCSAAGDLPGGLWQAVTEADKLDVLSVGGKDKVRNFMTTLAALWDVLPTLSLGQLVRRIYQATGYLTWALAQPDAPRKAGNIESIIHQAEVFCRGKGPTVGGLAEGLSQFRIEGIQAQDAPTGSAGDSVALMTVHAAKGLEAPVVFLADCNHMQQNSVPPIAYHPKVGAGFRVYLSDFSDASTMTLELLKQQSKVDADQEDLRLFYVAMTRARRRLIFSCAFRPDTRGTVRTYGWCTRTLAHLQLSAKDYDTWPDKVTPGDGIAVDVIKAEQVPEPAATAVIPAKVDAQAVLGQYDGLPEFYLQADMSLYLYTVSQVLDFAHCPRRFYLQHRLGVPMRFLGTQAEDLPDIEPGGQPSSRDVAVNLGIAVHEIFASVDPIHDPQWQNKGRAICNGFLLDENQTADALSWLAVFYARSEVKRWLTKAEPLREVPLLWEEKERALSGKIDLLLVDEQKVRIIDYKTNAAMPGDEDRLVEFYAPQMALYARAVSRLYPGREVEAWIYVTRTDHLAYVELDAPLPQKMGELLDSLFKADKTADFAANESRCPHCAHSGWCLSK